MKLLSITPLTGVTILGMRVSTTLTFKLGDARWAGWSFHIRGPLVFFETPPGWQVGSQARVGAERQVGQLPISQCYLEWRREPGDTLEQSTKYSIDVPEPVPPALLSSAAIEAGAEPVGVALDAPVPPATEDEDDDRPPQYRKKGK